ncbi:hypothetical protein OA50_00842 [Mameliella alba]|uniref:Uncharacterized protein n=1 Tax=Mameliella alba TaxID=561184 RepID=A0A0B3SC27_9RHOB|nr:hypothetical protein OA50_00842 [Mameliella alba]
MTLAVASFISQNGDPEDPEFRKALTGMMPDQWEYAIRHSKFHEPVQGLNSLDFTVRAMRTTFLRLNSEVGRMMGSFRISGWEGSEYRRTLQESA